MFLSASLPSPERHPAYAASTNPVAIREAVRALAEVVVPAARLVFGGHPDISPRVHDEAERPGAADNVLIYQSRFFEKVIPPASQSFRQLIWTPAGADRESSLLLMREQMLQSERFHAGVFIGGMEGVEEEFELFRRYHPSALIWRWRPRARRPASSSTASRWARRTPACATTWPMSRSSGGC
ncbi:hypothetical protein [Archangium sp.]|uniref:SLOG domain-containing protein n=1 Tax=Archangium sp. TaxID=1872627 RepID=UPI00389A7063